MFLRNKRRNEWFLPTLPPWLGASPGPSPNAIPQSARDKRAHLERGASKIKKGGNPADMVFDTRIEKKRIEDSQPHPPFGHPPQMEVHICPFGMLREDLGGLGETRWTNPWSRPNLFFTCNELAWKPINTQPRALLI